MRRRRYAARRATPHQRPPVHPGGRSRSRTTRRAADEQPLNFTPLPLAAPPRAPPRRSITTACARLHLAPSRPARHHTAHRAHARPASRSRASGIARTRVRHRAHASSGIARRVATHRMAATAPPHLRAEHACVHRIARACGASRGKIAQANADFVDSTYVRADSVIRAHKPCRRDSPEWEFAEAVNQCRSREGRSMDRKHAGGAASQALQYPRRRPASA